MIDVCRFLNSRDIADHLREIDYKFTAVEAAFIVYWCCSATLDDKIAAWQEIVETMPDCAMDKRSNKEPRSSLHGFLLDYIDLQKREIEQFFDSTGYAYSYSYYEDGYQEDGNLFNSAEDCIDYAKEYWNKDRWNEDDAPLEYRLEKKPIDHPCSSGASKLHLNRDMEILSVYCAGNSESDADLDLMFDGTWLALPTPFKRGDIVINACRSDDTPFVLHSLPTWGRAERIENGFEESDRFTARADWLLEHHRQNGDTTDMESMGYFISDAGIVYCECALCCYLDLEYFRGELTDSNRWTTVLSAQLKGEISFDEAANLMRYLQIDEEARQLKGILDAWCPNEYYPNGVWKKIRREET